MLVEAAAGTGKTTCMVRRMVALIRRGKCTVEKIAAVTFTRKAAAELKSRFRLELEKAAQEETSPDRDAIRQAVHELDRAFVGTIHSFCARLLRERPIEAGVGLGFEEIEADADMDLRAQAWEEFTDRLFATDDPLLGELEQLGLELRQLRDSFFQFAEYPDVQDWPSTPVELPDLAVITASLTRYAARAAALLPTFPNEDGDELMDAYERLVLMVRQANLSRTSELMDVLEKCKPRKIVQKRWPGGEAQAKAEQEEWSRFCDEAEPVLRCWREKRYPYVLDVLFRARAHYDRIRREAGVLNFQDLLIKAAELLRAPGQAHIRRYFRNRFRYLLVDEFQDTDPVQAEVMFLLTSEDPSETNWLECRPVPGSLFVVGDPRQSIYRFRRADITTYDQVRRIIEKCGKTEHLCTNFRSTVPLVEWINDTFADVFPNARTLFQPAGCPMEVGRPGPIESELSGVHVLEVPDNARYAEDAVQFETDLMARTISAWLNRHATIPVTSHPSGRPPTEPVQPGDILVITRNKKRLTLYAQKLQELGIPARVTGGSALQGIAELGLFQRCLRALCEPDNSVALVALLRSELFGFSDPALYAFRRAGGIFSFHSPVPELVGSHHDLFADAFTKLRTYESWLRQLPLPAGLERIIDDLGVLALAAARPGGNVQAGGIAKAIELVRAYRSRFHSLAEAVDYLEWLIEGGGELDAIEAAPPGPSVVRIMNLHKAKGLEAPIVFLADPTGASDHAVALHVDRSGERAQGYLAAHEQAGWGKRWLAYPTRWASFSDTEELFAAAEEQRLRYVAATRAGALLVISHRTKHNNRSPWAAFEPVTQKSPRLADPGRQVVSASTMPKEEQAAPLPDFEARYQVIVQPSYRIEAAKQSAVTGRLGPSYAEAGTEWGKVIHLLLQTAVTTPEADLADLAYASLREFAPELSDRADLVLATVRAVMRSEIWQRAMQSGRRLVEVPFQTLAPSASELPSGVPTIVRGVIDLIFREHNGWVIVDYKTDERPESELENLVEHYQGQVLLYADLWEQMVNEPVQEAGLYFTHLDRYAVVRRKAATDLFEHCGHPPVAGKQRRTRQY
jgi:ATP-dependent helicase/nuclease subunit A